MEFFTDLTDRVVALRDLLGEVARVEELPAAVARLGDADVVELITATSHLGRAIEQISLAASGVASTRSSRSAGHSGLAQSRGHRSPVAMIQRATGVTRSEAMRQVRVGQSLVEALEPAGASRGASDGDSVFEGEPSATEGRSRNAADVPWHRPLHLALTSGRISSAQFDAIKRGLGEPPVAAGAGAVPGAAGDITDPQSPLAADAKAATSETEAENAAIREIWSQAAEALVAEAAEVTAEELSKSARNLRDTLDPEGATRRYMQRYEARSFRMWVDGEGQHRGSFTFDDDSAMMLKTFIDSALRPRRGGPRFVDPEEKARADELIADPRSNDQLNYDLVLDLMKTGALADAKSVFGTKQASVRVVRVINPDAPEQAGAHYEDGLSRLPRTVAEQHICNSGTITVDVTRNGDPLNLGREQRLYSSRQRIALAVRDGGCRWNGCDRPASYCEAHHIDHWAADEGHTDIDRGILLCRFHHLQLHNNGWRISRSGTQPFMLHPPGGATAIELKQRVTLSYAWASAIRPRGSPLPEGHSWPPPPPLPPPVQVQELNHEQLEVQELDRARLEVRMQERAQFEVRARERAQLEARVRERGQRHEQVHNGRVNSPEAASLTRPPNQPKPPILPREQQRSDSSETRAMTSWLPAHRARTSSAKQPPSLARHRSSATVSAGIDPTS